MGTVRLRSVSSTVRLRAVSSIPGPTGATGATGPTGATGATGPTGPQGEAATIAVGTVTTLDAGQPVAVTNVGTAEEAIFDFDIPKGDPGDMAGPVSATEDNIATYGATPTTLKDSGVAISSLVTASSTTTFTNKTFDANGTGNSLSNVEAADIASGSKSGADATLVTGTAGTNGNLAMWNTDGDLIDGSVVAANVLVDGDIGTSVQAFDADTLKADTADVLTAGFAATVYNAGTQSGAGTYTPNEANGNFQRAVNGGAHTLAPPTNDCNIVIQYTNNGSAGAITVSGFTKVTGDAATTTDGHAFFYYITKNNGFSHLNVVALQ